MAKSDKKNLEDINKELKDSKKSTEEINKLQKEKIYLLEEEKRLQSESYDLSTRLIEDLKDELGIRSKRVTFDQDLLKVNKEITKTIQNQNVGITSIEEKAKQIAKNNQLIAKAKVSQLSIEKGLAKDAKVRMGYAKTSITNINQLNDKLADGVNLTEKQEQKIKAQIESREKTLATQLKSLKKEERKYLITQRQLKEIEKQNAEREKELKIAEKLEDTMGMTGKLAKLMGTIPGLGGIAGDAAKKVEGEIQRSVEKGGEIPSKMKAAGMVFSKMKDNVKKALTDPLTIAIALAAQLAQAFKAVDEQSGEFAKNQGLSYATTVELRGEMSAIARSSEDILVTSKGLMETQGRLSELMGSQVKFSDEMLEDFTQLNRRLKMSKETQEVIAKQVLKTGKSAKDLTAEINGQVLKQNEQRKISMSFKEVQDAIGKSSKSLQLTFKGNVKELVNQVSAAKALGTTLDKVESIASSLLDFESSIQAELEAELLLGKDINLEKARQAALEGDMATVADEVLKNKAIMNAFETKNVIAQQAAAKALGMSRNDLAAMVKEQQQLELVRSKGFDDLKSAQKEYNDLRAQGYSAEEAALATGGEALQDQMESASAAERLAAIMEQIQEIFIGMAEPVLGLVDNMTKLVGGAENLGKILMGVAGVYVAIKGYQLATLAVQGALKAAETVKLGIMTAQAGAALTINAASTFGIGTVIAVGAVTAAMAALATYFVMKDGVIDPKKGPVISGEFGTVQIDPNDQIAVGTDLMGENKPKGERGGGARRDAVLISEIQTLIGVNRQILAKSSTIEINGNKVGEEISKSDRVIN
jgi:hypothetical protein